MHADLMPLTARPAALLRDGDGHAVLFYDSEMGLVVEVTDFVFDALDAGDRALVVATPQHRASTRASLPSDVRRQAELDDRLTILDAGTTLGLFMRNGVPDPALFDRHVGQIIRERLCGGARLAVYGEMVALLWSDNEHPGAIALEELWNGLRQRLDFTLLCAYPREAVQREGTDGYARICSTHNQLAVSATASSGVARAERAPLYRSTTHASPEQTRRQEEVTP